MSSVELGASMSERPPGELPGWVYGLMIVAVLAALVFLDKLDSL